MRIGNIDVLERQRALQVRIYDADPSVVFDAIQAGLASDTEIDWWFAYLKDMTTAAMVELGEFLQCFRWKSWGKRDSEMFKRSRSEAIEELVDVQHFVANLFLALDVTEAELTDIYTAKHAINHKRQDDGYRG